MSNSNITPIKEDTQKDDPQRKVWKNAPGAITGNTIMTHFQTITLEDATSKAVNRLCEEGKLNPERFAVAQGLSISKPAAITTEGNDFEVKVTGGEG